MNSGEAQRAWRRGISSLVLLTALNLAVIPSLSWPTGGRCPEGYTAYPTYIDPNNPEVVHGRIDPVFICDGAYDITNLSPIYTWSPGFERYLYLFDGFDQDVCVNDSNPYVFFLYYDGIYMIPTWWGAPGHPDPGNPWCFHFAPPQPSDGQVVSYTLTGQTDDSGPWNVGDETAQAQTFPRVFHPFARGDPIHGIIDKRAVGTSPTEVKTTFTRTATYRWTDQFVSAGSITFSAYAVWDFDKFENGVEPLNWNDGMANDLDAPEAEIHWPDYTWSAVAGAVGRIHCYSTTYTCPQVMWATQVTVNLAIDDNTPFEYADDPPINDSITFKVYRDHLQRDYCNEGDLNKYHSGRPGVRLPWRCNTRLRWHGRPADAPLEQLDTHANILGRS
jgi:hypothetical protein